MSDPAAKYFSPKVTCRERAAFEAGIAIGTLLHQFTGVPIRTREDVEIIGRAIERSLLAQPFREMVEVKIELDRSYSSNPYDYTTLKSRFIDATIVVRYDKCRVKARVRYIPELDYTLGYIEDIEEA